MYLHLKYIYIKNSLANVHICLLDLAATVYSSHCSHGNSCIIRCAMLMPDDVSRSVPRVQGAGVHSALVLAIPLLLGVFFTWSKAVAVAFP